MLVNFSIYVFTYYSKDPVFWNSQIHLLDKRKINAHQNYYVVQHNFTFHFCLAPVKVKKNPQPVPVGTQNNNLCFSMTTTG